MKRIFLATACAGLLAAIVAALGFAQPTASTGTTKATAAQVKAPVLPPLPAEIKQRQRFNVGVKCDAPPFGYIDVRGKNAGFDVEIAKWFARYAFGREQRVSFFCAPSPAREPLLTTNRVDLVISTFTYTTDRDTRIDFSRAYYKATGRLLVKNTGPVQSLADIAGKRVSTTSGSIYDRWLKRCHASTQVTVTDSFTNALLAFNQGRADALMWDDTVLVGVAAADQSAKLTEDTFLALPYGIGIKQGNVELKRWVDSRLELMRKKDTFMAILRNNVPARFVAGFSRNILRPNNTFGYARRAPRARIPFASSGRPHDHDQRKRPRTRGRFLGQPVILATYDLWAFVSENYEELLDGLLNTLKVSAFAIAGAFLIGSCSAPPERTGSRW